MSYSIQKGAARLAVEAALRAGTEESPLSAQQVADRAGIDITVARTHIANCVNRELAYNLNKGHRGYGLYVWGQAAQPERVPAAPRYIPTEPLVIKPIEYARPNAGDAFELPSLHNGELVPRQRPMLIGAPQVARA